MDKENLLSIDWQNVCRQIHNTPYLNDLYTITNIFDQYFFDLYLVCQTWLFVDQNILGQLQVDYTKLKSINTKLANNDLIKLQTKMTECILTDKTMAD